MDSYFVRHTKALAVSDAVIQGWSNTNRIAVHFPGDGETDSRSLDPTDYEKQSERKGIKAFTRLARTGGYVWAQYSGVELATIGIVRPGEVQFQEEDWVRYKGKLGRKALLKTLPIHNARKINPRQFMHLRAMRPRQGTISRWPKVGKFLGDAVEGRRPEISWGELAPSQQEIAVAEFLREGTDPSIPRLRMLLMPPGRTLKDVDIYGLTDSGRRLFVQVTNYGLSQSAEKADRLREYSGPDTELLLVCSHPKKETVKGIQVMPVGIVDSWIKSNKAVTAFFWDGWDD